MSTGPGGEFFFPSVEIAGADVLNGTPGNRPLKRILALLDIPPGVNPEQELALRCSAAGEFTALAKEFETARVRAAIAEVVEFRREREREQARKAAVT